ncbi:MAG: hypothetical protein D4R97_00100 [Bacteroidetes bacterium]|nr:MAG: hypothetical protein D4R97_00100 [Bacteroidota bacterium]
MKYFKAKVVKGGEEILAFVAPVQSMSDENRPLMYDRQGDIEYHGLADDVDTEEVLGLQHAECEVEEVTFADMEEILKGSRLYKEINAQVEKRIRDHYSIGDEFSMLKLAKTAPERVAYQKIVDDFCQAGLDQKIALGLKQ